MHPLASAAATLLMLLFAIGVLGCAITIPICAVKFFAILFEGKEEVRVPQYPQYRPAEAAAFTEGAEPPRQESSRARSAAAGR